MRALIIIDIQKDYFPGGRMPLCNPESAVEAAARVRDFFRKNGEPVYYVRHIAPRNASFFAEGSGGSELYPALTPGEGEKVIVKHAPNSFYKTELLSELKKARATELVFCGMMTHMCVDTTVRAARDFGFGATLISNACATCDLTWNGRLLPAELVQEVFFASLSDGFARVVNDTEFINGITDGSNI